MSSAFFLCRWLRRGRCCSGCRLYGNGCFRCCLCRRYGLMYPGSRSDRCCRYRFLRFTYRCGGALKILLDHFIGGCGGLCRIRFLRNGTDSSAHHAGSARKLLLNIGCFCGCRAGHRGNRLGFRWFNRCRCGCIRCFRLLTGMHDPGGADGILDRGRRFRLDTVGLQFIPGFLPGQDGIFGRKRIRRKGSIRVLPGAHIRMVKDIAEPLGIFFHKRRGEVILGRNGRILRFIYNGVKQEQFVVFFIESGLIRSVGIQVVSSFLGAN